MSFVRVCLWMCMFACASVRGSNILGLFPTQARSAFTASEIVMKGLARKGHNVTVVSCFPQKNPVKNYKDIDIGSIRGTYESSLDFKQYNFPYVLSDLMPFFKDVLIDSMGNILKSDAIRGLILSNTTFDVVFHEMFVDDIFLLLARKFKAHIIAIGPSYILPWAADRFAIPQNPSYIPVLGNGFSRRMSFFERLKNTMTYLSSNYDYRNSLVPKSLEVYRKYMKDSPHSVDEVGKEVSMYFVNAHYSLLGARPLPPQVVEIGGIHIQPVRPLPQDLDRWMNESSHRVIYFCFGSMLRGASLPEAKVQVFLQVFRRLSQRVLWKWEEKEMAELPSNVKVMKWLPQRDILAHPTVRLFISHGGLLGTTEATVSGVPVLGIPTNLDQANNVAALQDLGAGIYLDYNNISEASLSGAIHNLLTDRSYTDNSKKLSQRFQDRPMSALDTAIYWTEYVIRHKGARHLQSAAVHLSWVQQHLLDVLAVCVAATLTGVVLIWTIFRLCIRLLSKKVSKQKNS